MAAVQEEEDEAAAADEVLVGHRVAVGDVSNVASCLAEFLSSGPPVATAVPTTTGATSAAASASAVPATVVALPAVSSAPAGGLAGLGGIVDILRSRAIAS